MPGTRLLITSKLQGLLNCDNSVGNGVFSTYLLENTKNVPVHVRVICFLLKEGLEVIKLEYSLKIKGNDWLLVDMCPQTANDCALF